MRILITRWVYLVACVLGLLSSRALADAAPAPSIPGAVMVVLGFTEGEGVDGALAKIEALHKPPFDSFPKKTLLTTTNTALSMGKEVEVELPNGRKLRLLLVEKTAEGRFRVSLSINRPGKPDYLPLMTVVAAPGDPFFVAGQKHQGGTLIIGITVGQASPTAATPKP